MLINANLIIDGEKLKTQIEIDEADLKAMQNKKKTGYERVGDSGEYYWDSNDGLTYSSYDENLSIENLRYDTANYYSSEEVAKNNARADQLMRKLRRFAVENRKDKTDWNNEERSKYYISYNCSEKKIKVNADFILRAFGDIYFDSEEVAKKAIEEFKDELIWYFTEYKDSL
jgi:hypothetical protein